MVFMSMDLSLFGDEEPDVPAAEPAVAPSTAWQIDLLRKALDARGLLTMDERQALIEDVVGRPVGSLRSMTHDEAMLAISKLGSSASASPVGSASLWDSRDEDTWIDRL